MNFKRLQKKLRETGIRYRKASGNKAKHYAKKRGRLALRIMRMMGVKI